MMVVYVLWSTMLRSRLGARTWFLYSIGALGNDDITHLSNLKLGLLAPLCLFAHLESAAETTLSFVLMVWCVLLKSL